MRRGKWRSLGMHYLRKRMFRRAWWRTAVGEVMRLGYVRHPV